MSVIWCSVNIHYPKTDVCSVHNVSTALFEFTSYVAVSMDEKQDEINIQIPSVLLSNFSTNITLIAPAQLLFELV